MTTGSTITVVIPTRVRPTLARAIRSVRAQSRLPDELLVSVDGYAPLDDSAQAELTALSGAGVRCEVLHNGPVGVQRARNAALERVTSTFATFLDDDDEFTASRLAAFERNWNDDGSLLCSFDYFVSGDRVQRERRTMFTIDLEALYIDNFIGNQVFTLTERIRSVGGYDESLEAAQDYDLWLRLVRAFGPAHVVPDASQRRHVSRESISTNVDRRRRGYTRNYFKHRIPAPPAVRAWKVVYLRHHSRRALRASWVWAVLINPLPVQVKRDALMFFAASLKRRILGGRRSRVDDRSRAA